MVNKVILIGRLGRDAELRFTPQGTPVTSFSLATERTWKDHEGQDHKDTDWHQLVLWGKLAESLNEHLTKGRLIYVEGHLRTRSWEDEHQSKHYRTEVWCEHVKFLDHKRDHHSPIPEEDIPL